MKRTVMILGLLLSLLLAGCGAVREDTADTFTLTFITVGKGDAFLMESPEGRHYLLDTGKAQDYQQIVRVLRLKGIDRLDGIFLTHGHKDHAGCLEPLLEGLPVDRVYISRMDTVSYTEIDPRKIVPRFENTELVELEGGEVLEIGGAEAQIWIPSSVDLDNANNNSLVMRVTHGTQTFLLMGDAELEEEAELMKSEFPLESTVLKLGHHGETDASSSAFLDQVRPQIALIAGSADENPDSENPVIAERLEQRGIEAYYSKGASLDFCSDGSRLTVRKVEERELPRDVDLEFTEVNRKEQAVTVRNVSDGIADLTGCTLISERGDEIYHFPEGTFLEPDMELTIVCRDSNIQGDLVWNTDSVWKKHRDTALLYDMNMNLLDSDPADQSIGGTYGTNE